jgi:hypothetical protein
MASQDGLHLYMLAPVSAMTHFRPGTGGKCFLNALLSIFGQGLS